MYTEITTRTDERTELEDWQLSPLSETAKAICDKAFNLARAKLPLWQQEIELDELLQRHDFVGYFKHAMSMEVAQVIAAYDRHALALYLFEESANPDAQTEEYPANIDLTIHLLTLVTSASAALEAFVTSLDRALVENLHKLPLPAYAGRTSILDVIPVTQRDVQNRRGYASLLSSFYARPIKLWERD
jgi:hypothetical protein